MELEADYVARVTETVLHNSARGRYRRSLKTLPHWILERGIEKWVAHDALMHDAWTMQYVSNHNNNKA